MDIDFSFLSPPDPVEPLTESGNPHAMPSGALPPMPANADAHPTLEAAPGGLRATRAVLASPLIRAYDHARPYEFIYVLCQNERAVYVGRTVEPKTRINTHRRGGHATTQKAFTSAHVFACHRQQANLLEGALIRFLQPVHNTAMIGPLTAFDAGILSAFGVGVDMDASDPAKRASAAFAHDLAQ